MKDLSDLVRYYNSYCLFLFQDFPIYRYIIT